MLNSAAFVALTATIDRSQVAMAASTFFLSANGGMAVGMASASAVIQSSLRSGLEAKLGDIPNRASVRLFSGPSLCGYRGRVNVKCV
jgi:hypothetical protein